MRNPINGETFFDQLLGDDELISNGSCVWATHIFCTVDCMGCLDYMDDDQLPSYMGISLKLTVCP